MADKTGKTVDERIKEYHDSPEPKVEEQPAPTPSADQTTEEPVEQPKVEEVVPEGNEVAEEAEALANSKNPERTKSYIEKLKAERDELKKKVEPQTPEPQYGESVLDSIFTQPQTPKDVPMPQINTPYLNPSQQQNIAQQFVDQEGNVDIAGLNRALTEANQRAFDAFQRVQNLEQKMARVEQTDQVREAHAKFPDIDPTRKDTFNPKLYEAVRDRLVRNLMDGKAQKLSEVVEQVKETYFSAPVAEQVKQQAVEEYKKTQEARNQGPFEGGRPRVSDSDLGELRKQTRQGGQRGDEALSKRLKALGL